MHTELKSKPTAEIHVVPFQDLVAHEIEIDCVCVPRIDFVERANGPIGWMYVHHSLDGREAL